MCKAFMHATHNRVDAATVTTTLTTPAEFATHHEWQQRRKKDQMSLP